MTYEEILSHFQVKKYGNGKAQALCPAHPDKEASLTITQGNDGKTLLKCHAGCSSESVVLAAGLKMADLFSENRLSEERRRMYIESREKRKIEAVYNYVSTNGDYAYTKIRLEGKKMLFGMLNDERFEYGLKGRGISAEAREDILVQAFLTCPNISEISKKTKIPGPTIYTVIHTDSFQRKYSEARNEAVTGAIAYLQGKLGECAAVLVNTATDTEVPAQIRVNAANAALSQCSQWTKNVDMIERLEAMEELMSQVEQEQKLQKRKK